MFAGNNLFSRRGHHHYRRVVGRWMMPNYSRTTTTAPTLGKFKGLLLSSSSSPSGGCVGSVRGLQTQDISSLTTNHPDSAVRMGLVGVVALATVLSSMMTFYWFIMDTKLESNRVSMESKIDRSETKIDGLKSEIDGMKKEIETKIDGLKKDVIDAINSKLDSQDRCKIDGQDRKIDALDRTLDSAKYRTKIMDGQYRNDDETPATSVLATTISPPAGRA